MSEDPKNESAPVKKGSSTKRLALVAGVTALATAAVVGLLVNVFEKKSEARNPFFRVVELTEETDDPAVWGRNFPLQYDHYRRTVDQQRTREAQQTPKQMSVLREHRAALEFPTSTLQPIRVDGTRANTAS